MTEAIPCGHTWRTAGPCPHCHPPVDARTSETAVLDDALIEAVAAERARCAAIARNAAAAVRDRPILLVSPEKLAADLADDIADMIEGGEAPWD